MEFNDPLLNPQVPQSEAQEDLTTHVQPQKQQVSDPSSFRALVTTPPTKNSANPDIEPVAQKTISDLRESSRKIESHEVLKDDHIVVSGSRIPESLKNLGRKLSGVWGKIKGWFDKGEKNTTIAPRGITGVGTSSLGQESVVNNAKDIPGCTENKIVEIDFVLANTTSEKDTPAKTWAMLKEKIKGSEIEMIYVHNNSFVRDVNRGKYFINGEELTGSTASLSDEELKEWYNKLSKEKGTAGGDIERLGIGTDLGSATSYSKQLQSHYAYEKFENKHIQPESEIFKEDTHIDQENDSKVVDTMRAKYEATSSLYEKMKKIDMTLDSIIEKHVPILSNSENQLLRYQIEDQLFQRILALDYDFFGQYGINVGSYGYGFEMFTEFAAGFAKDSLIEARGIIENEIENPSLSKTLNISPDALKKELEEIDNVLQDIQDPKITQFPYFMKVSDDGILTIEKSQIFRINVPGKALSYLENMHKKEAFMNKTVRIQIDLKKIENDSLLFTPGAVTAQVEYSKAVSSLKELSVP